MELTFEWIFKHWLPLFHFLVVYILIVLAGGEASEQLGICSWQDYLIEETFSTNSWAASMTPSAVASELRHQEFLPHIWFIHWSVYSCCWKYFIVVLWPYAAEARERLTYTRVSSEEKIYSWGQPPGEQIETIREGLSAGKVFLKSVLCLVNHRKTHMAMTMFPGSNCLFSIGVTFLFSVSLLSNLSQHNSDWWCSFRSNDGKDDLSND